MKIDEAVVLRSRIYIPELEPGLSGSWVVSRKTGEVIGEFFDRRNVEKFNGETCIVETTYQYLCRISEETKVDS